MGSAFPSFSKTEFAGNVSMGAMMGTRVSRLDSVGW